MTVSLRTFNNPSLFVRNTVKLVNQLVNLIVGCADFAVGSVKFRRRGLGAIPFLVQLQHALHERHHLVVLGFVGAVGKIDRANGKLLDVLPVISVIALYL